MATEEELVDELGFPVSAAHQEEFLAQREKRLRADARQRERCTKFLRRATEVKNYRRKRTRKIKKVVRLGVPPDLRTDMWMFMSGADEVQRECDFSFEELVQHAMQICDPIDIESIDKDINRTYPEVHTFPVQGLRRVLLALVASTTLEYCQGMNYLAGILLLVTQNEEKAFWLLYTLLIDIIPSTVYHLSMRGLKAEFSIIHSLLASKRKRICRYLEEMGLEESMYCTQWIICCFCGCTPAEVNCRILDCLFFEGWKVALRMTLAYLIVHEEKLYEADNVGMVMMDIKKSAMNDHDVDRLFHCAFRIPRFGKKRIRRLRIRALRELGQEEHCEISRSRSEIFAPVSSQSGGAANGSASGAGDQKSGNGEMASSNSSTPT
mgnify:FL=1